MTFREIKVCRFCQECLDGNEIDKGVCAECQDKVLELIKDFYKAGRPYTDSLGEFVYWLKSNPT